MSPLTPAEPNGIDGQPSLLRPGRVLFSRYRLEHPLGGGPLGFMWLAHDRNLDRPVALKVLNDSVYSNPAAHDAIKRETCRAVELSHPNIVRVHDFAEDGEAGAITVEYIDGATLTELRLEHRQNCLEVGGLGSWVAELCHAIDHAHRVGQIVHGDLKPANLLISSAGVLKVTDFGVACAVRNEVAALREQTSSLGYMSPQQHRGEKATSADDIYSIGAILYEALTSRPPLFSSDTPDRMAIRRHKLGVAGEPIPDHWEETILACLQREPENRPSSAADVARLLGVELLSAPQAEPSTQESALVVSAKGQSSAAAKMAASAACAAARLGRSGRHFASAAARIGSRLALTAKDRLPAIASAACGAIVRSWRRPGPFRKLAPGGITLAAGVLILAAAWPKNDVQNIAPPKARQARAIPAYAITAPTTSPTTSAPHAAPAAATIDTGGLTIKSEPPGATVSIDGVPGELTPLSLSEVTPGEHVVALQLVGFDRVSIPTVIRAGQTADLGTIALQRSTGTLQVITDPAGAQVMLGGRELGRTPLTAKLSTGVYRGITTHLDGYAEMTFDATVAANETLTLPPIMLKPELPRLAISTEPSGMSYALFHASAASGAAEPISAGKTPATVEGLQPGKYRVALDGEKSSVQQTIEVAQSGVTTFHRSLPRGKLRVESAPPGAEVFNGEVSLGRTPLQIAMPEGVHAITAEYDDRTARPRTVRIASGRTESLNFDFTPAKSSSTTASKSSRSRKPRRKVEPPGTFTKIGRSLKNFFD
jgi:hypothetical protein